MNTPIIQPGIDLTVADCITASDVMQAISTAYFQPNIGGIIHSPTSPNVITYPDAKRFIWDKTSAGESVGECYYWNGTTWTLLIVFDPADLPTDSIPIDRLENGGAYEIIQMNSAGTAPVWISIPNAIQNNTVPVAKLVKPATANTVLFYDGSNIAFTAISSVIIASIADNSLPIAKLVKGAARSVLRTNVAGTAPEWAAPGTLFEAYEIPVISLATDTLALTNTAGVVTLDAEDGGPAWYISLTANVTDFNVTNLADGREITVLIQQDGVGARTLVWDAAIIWPTATAPTIASAASAKTLVTFKQVNGATYGELSAVAGSITAGIIIESAEIAIPAAGAAIAPITVPSKPRSMDWVLRCTDAGGDAGYAENDEISALSCITLAGQDDMLTFTPWRNLTQMGLVRNSDASANSIGSNNKSTGVASQLDSTKWMLVCYYSL